MTAQFPVEDPTWSLDTIFEGGVEAPGFDEEAEALPLAFEEIAQRLEELPEPSEGLDEKGRGSWAKFFADYFGLYERVGDAGAYARAQASAQADRPEAAKMIARLEETFTRLEQLIVAIQSRFRGVEDGEFEALLNSPGFEDLSTWLGERRRDADASMDPALEGLAVELCRDGLHAWWNLYQRVTGEMKVRIETEEGVEERSVGQTAPLMEHPDRKVRKAAFDGLQEAWGGVATVCAAALNSKVGIEQTLYNRRGQDCLTQALQLNRVERESVEAMMSVAREFRPLLTRYLEAKARALGQEKLAWWDVRAPLGELKEEITYPQAQRFIVDQVEEFSPAMAEFFRHALSSRWVEVEDRPGKAQGGYCTGFPRSREFRIFMTFGGTNAGVTTLAHELGHGYHFWVMKDLARSKTQVPMTLAETASTLAEALVEQAALRQAPPEEKLALLDERLNRSMAFLAGLPARYDLEKAMHRERARGVLDKGLLSDITEEIFTEAYGGAIESVDRLHWASKLHYFLTRYPFYNFPYTFGYLFSRAVYAKAMQEGDGFVQTIDEMLLDSGVMTCEEIASRYLGADLGEPEFWRLAAGTLEEDVERFEALVLA